MHAASDLENGVNDALGLVNDLDSRIRVSSILELVLLVSRIEGSLKTLIDVVTAKTADQKMDFRLAFS